MGKRGQESTYSFLAGVIIAIILVFGFASCAWTYIQGQKQGEEDFNRIYEVVENLEDKKSVGVFVVKGKIFYFVSPEAFPDQLRPYNCPKDNACLCFCKEKNKGCDEEEPYECKIFSENYIFHSLTTLNVVLSYSEKDIETVEFERKDEGGPPKVIVSTIIAE